MKKIILATALIVALITASGAVAAQKYIITSTKQIKPSVMQSLKGKQGTPGLNGATGDTGPQGSRGPAGATGPDGAEGAPGKQGATGAKGEAGPQGTSGAKGDTGIQGVKGDTGAVGIKGDKGDTGPAGPSGGGISGYEVVTNSQIFNYSGTGPYLLRLAAKCPAGKKVLGGGWWDGDPQGSTIQHNAPIDDNTAWQVWFITNDTTFSATVNAICVNATS